MKMIRISSGLVIGCVLLSGFSAGFAALNHIGFKNVELLTTAYSASDYTDAVLKTDEILRDLVSKLSDDDAALANKIIDRKNAQSLMVGNSAHQIAKAYRSQTTDSAVVFAIICALSISSLIVSRRENQTMNKKSGSNRN